MDGHEFYARIQDHEQLTWLATKEGPTPNEAFALICNHLGFKYAVTLGGIKEAPWDQLEAVLLTRRAPQVMTHVTRIVGYYSQLQNWNASKRAELRDRHKGSYGVPEPVVVQMPAMAIA